MIIAYLASLIPPSLLGRSKHHLSPVWIRKSYDDLVDCVRCDTHGTQLVKKLLLILNLEVQVGEIRIRTGRIRVLRELYCIMDGKLQAVRVSLPVDVAA
jgi:hypothetical protein